MFRSRVIRSWFVAPPLGAKWITIWIILSLPVATLIRMSMNCPDAVGECCTPFFLFVLLSAILLGAPAAMIATGSSAVVSALLYSHQHMPMPGRPSEFWGIFIFLLYSAIIIGTVEYTRRSLVRFARLDRPRETSSGVIFSLEGGQAWASWPGNPTPVSLGPKEEVASMMYDFISQIELAERLERRTNSAQEASYAVTGA